MENPFAKRKHDSRDLGVAFCNRHAGTPAMEPKNKIRYRVVRASGSSAAAGLGSEGRRGGGPIQELL